MRKSVGLPALRNCEDVFENEMSYERKRSPKKIIPNILSGMCVRIINRRKQKSKILFRQMNDVIERVKLKIMIWQFLTEKGLEELLKAEDCVKKGEL